jgi:hypothetical protein
LTDLAAHGAILGIRGTSNVDLLGPALERELSMMRRDPPSSHPRALAVSAAPAPPYQGQRGEVPGPMKEETFEDAPSSLEDAVIRQISDPTPPGRVSAVEVSIVDASELKTRAPAMASEFPAHSLPPDAIIPGSASDERMQAAERVAPANEEIERLGEEDILPRAADGEASSSPSRITLPPRAIRGGVATNLSDAMTAISVAPPVPKRSANFALAALVALATIAVLTSVLRYGRAPSGRESAVDTAAPVAAPGPSSVLVVESTAAAPRSRVAAPSRVEVPAAPSRVEVPAPPSRGAAPDRPEAIGTAQPGKGEDDAIPQGVAVGTGQGLLDIETGDRTSIFIDGIEQGRGPFLRIALAPGTHDVRLRGLPDTNGSAEIRGSGQDQVRQVMVRSGRRTRLSLAPIWTR